MLFGARRSVGSREASPSHDLRILFPLARRLGRIFFDPFDADHKKSEGDDMQLTPSQLKTYRATYNSLPDDVDAAYEKLLKNPARLKIIRGALRIIKKHDVEKVLGLFLLHRHFACPPGRVFVERRYTPRKRHAPVLVTQAEPVSKAPLRVSAHRFSIARDGKLQPLEFTTDAIAAAVNKQLVTDEHLSRELGGFLASNGASSTLGVGIFVRTDSMGKATSVFLEETNFEDRSSVVHVLPKLPHEVGRAVPTLWTFGLNTYGCCTGQCVAYCNHLGGLGYCGHRKTGGHMVCV